jgi:hypothetical protein
MEANEWAVVIVKLKGSGRMRLHTYLFLLSRSCVQELRCAVGIGSVSGDFNRTYLQCKSEVLEPELLIIHKIIVTILSDCRRGLDLLNIYTHD